MTVLLPGTIWSAFSQLLLTWTPLTVVPNNLGKHNFGCNFLFIFFVYNLLFIIFSWSKSCFRSDSHKFGITLPASLVAVTMVEVVAHNFNPKCYLMPNLYFFHSSIKSIKSPHTVRKILPLSSYNTAWRNMPFILGESICLILCSHFNCG